MLTTPIIQQVPKQVDRAPNPNKTGAQSFCVWFHDNFQCICQCGGEAEEELPPFTYAEMDMWDASKYVGDDVNSFRTKVSDQVIFLFINEYIIKLTVFVNYNSFIPQNLLFVILDCSHQYSQAPY